MGTVARSRTKYYALLAGAFVLLCAAGVMRRAPHHASPAGIVDRRPGHRPRAALGLNIGEVNYYTTQVAYLDLVQQAPDWGLFSNGEMPRVDAHGWPVALTEGHGAGFVATVPEPGRYVAVYEGDGEIALERGGSVVAQTARRVEFDLAGGEAHFRLVRTNPANPLRDLHIVPIAHETTFRTEIFDPKFLEIVRPFGVLRFLDWLRINGSPMRRWADRANPDDFSQGTERGVSIESTIDLCNRVHSDCWLNVPHMADDDYVRGYAEVVRGRLDPSLKAYVEYSNEIWGFPHGDYCQHAGERLGMPHEWETRIRYQARRSVEIFRIFESALGRDRLVRVLAGQSAAPERIRLLLEFEDAYRSADAVAIAPYFCSELATDEHVADVRTLPPARLARLCSADVDRERLEVRAARELADEFGLPLIAYEAGQSIVTSPAFHGDEALQALLDQTNRDPEMGRAYRRYFEMWKEEGGELFMLFESVKAPNPYGRWGLLESTRQPLGDAPKYRAALDFLRNTPPWWRPADPRR